MTSAAFEEFFARVFQAEGDLSLDPADSGNWTGGICKIGELKGTKYGISAAQFPTLDIENLTIFQARDIYYNQYWLDPGFWRLQTALGVRVADVGVTAGSATATKMLQRAVNAVCTGTVAPRRLAPWREKICRLLGGNPLLVDGKIGPITADVVKLCPYKNALLVAFQGEAYIHYRRLNPLYIPGWLERLGR